MTPSSPSQSHLLKEEDCRHPGAGLNTCGVRDGEAQPYAYHDCPFDTRLARTPYLVMPKLAIQAMPMAWRERLEALLLEAEAAGIETPEYHVFRDDGPGEPYTRAYVVNEMTGFVRIVKGRDDPWANYRHGSIRALCPNYRGEHR